MKMKHFPWTVLRVHFFVALLLGLWPLEFASATEPPAGESAPSPVRANRDISGDWKFEIGGRSKQSGIVKLTRDATLDSDGFEVFTGPVTYADGTTSSKPWKVGVRGNDVAILTEFAVVSCAGSFDERGRIKGRCKFVEDYLGPLLMIRIADSE